NLVQLSATATLIIDQSVYVSGNLAFSKGATALATLSATTSHPTPPAPINVSILTVGASNVNIFVGSNGPASNPSAIGLSIQNASFGLALLKPTDATNHSSYYGLKATASSVALVGVDPSVFDLSLGNLSVEVNGGTDTADPNRVVDFTKGNLDGANPADHAMSIPTGGDPVTLDGFTSKMLQASTDLAVLSIGGFVQIHGGFAFSKSAPVAATLTNGTSKNLAVTTFG